MKKICTLDNIPRNDELKITERARKLMEGVSAGSEAVGLWLVVTDSWLTGAVERGHLEARGGERTRERQWQR
jgi:hypothetical protein